ncbi:MAG TPA: hypothetical protein ENI45_03390 [Thermoplasmatales archaeon]|nr:hypothetical protein [Thermoplasmatales archaeon]
MPLEKLIAQIEEDANREIDRILGEAKAEVKRRVKEAEKKAREEAAAVQQRATKELGNKKRSELARMRQEVKKELLKKKEEVISVCFERALEKLKTLPSEEYVALVKPLIEEGVKEIGRDCVILASREEDKRLARELKLPVEKQMVKAVGGVIIKSRDGRVTVDNTFEGVLKRKENEIRTEIGRLLFTET